MIAVAAKDTTKLPKWVQDRIADCERRCNEAENRLRDYLDNQSQSLIYTRRGLTEKSYIQDDRVCFELTGGEITVALRDDALECHAIYRGGDRLIVRPHVTNVVWLEIHSTP